MKLDTNSSKQSRLAQLLGYDTKNTICDQGRTATAKKCIQFKGNHAR